MNANPRMLILLACGALLTSCANLSSASKAEPASAPASLLLHPDAPEMNRQAPALFDARLQTSKGLIVIEVHRDWAPHGADRFYNLVRAGYYDGARFFRVIEGRWAQFGINGDPRISNAWRTRTLPDDPRRVSNVRGTVAFAFAVPDGRTTQVFINLRDNSATHDAEPFVPFGKVAEGMDVADRLNAEYGESSGSGIRAGRQEPLFEWGNRYLEQNFPRLDYIQRAVIVEPARVGFSRRISLALGPSLGFSLSRGLERRNGTAHSNQVINLNPMFK